MDNLGLVEFVKTALNEKCQYLWGCFGQKYSLTLLNSKLKQYPKQIGQFENFIKSNHLVGVRVFDCVGLIKGYYWNGQYQAKTDVSADKMFNVAEVKGDIDTMSEIPGLLVRYSGHIGAYIGEGYVIEARGTKYGVVKTKLDERPWTHWLKCPFIDYVAGDKITILINGDELKMDVDPINVNGRIMVPVRAIAETLGCSVEWNGDTQTVMINSK